MNEAIEHRRLFRLRAPAAALERAVSLAAWLAAATITAVFLWIVGDMVRRGMAELSWSLLIDSPRDAGRAGGLAPMIVSTLMLMGVCLAASVPIGLGTAILLAEFSDADSRFGVAIRRCLDVLAGVPSIVFGLFGHELFSVRLRMGYSIMAGGLTLACMVLPVLIRSVEQGLRAVPDEYRLAAAALGLSRTAVLCRILLPAATPALLVGLMLAIGRAGAETAALLFTSGSVDRMPGSLWHSGRALSIHIYELATNVPGGDARAYAAAVVLIVLLLIVNLATFMIGDRWLHARITRR